LDISPVVADATAEVPNAKMTSDATAAHLVMQVPARAIPSIFLVSFWEATEQSTPTTNR
jgi:hypothetical protein